MKYPTMKLVCITGVIIILSGCAGMLPQQKLATYNNDPIKRAKNTLHGAVKQGNQGQLARLIANNADVNMRDELGKTPLYIAAEFGNTDATKMLLDNGADPAIAIPESDEMDGPNYPLSIAAFKDYVDIVKILLNAGADPNARDERGFTALHYAVLYSSLHTNNMLVEAGADAMARTRYGVTPLHHAVMRKANQPTFDLMSLLLENGAEINAVSDALRKWREELVWFKKQNHAETCWEGQVEVKRYWPVCWDEIAIGATDSTPLMVVFKDVLGNSYAYENESRLARFLIDNGADPHKSAHDGENAFAEADTYGFEHYDKFAAYVPEMRSVSDDNDSSSFVKTVATSVTTAVVANKAGMDTDRAAQLGISTARNVDADGVSGGLKKSLNGVNGDTRKRQRAMTENSQSTRKNNSSSNNSARDGDVSAYEKSVDRSNLYVRCIQGGGTHATCSRKAQEISLARQSNHAETSAQTQNSRGEEQVRSKDSSATNNSKIASVTTSRRKVSSTSKRKQLPANLTRDKWKRDVPEAMMYCWTDISHNPDLEINSEWFRCHGPNDLKTHQMAGNGWASIQRHSSGGAVGCAGADLARAKQWLDGYIIPCGRGKNNEDIDIAKVKNIPASKLPRRYSFKCRRRPDINFAGEVFYKERYVCEIGDRE